MTIQVGDTVKFRPNAGILACRYGKVLHAGSWESTLQVEFEVTDNYIERNVRRTYIVNGRHVANFTIMAHDLEEVPQL